MFFDYSEKTKSYIDRVQAFMDEHVYPNEQTYLDQNHSGERWKVIQIIEDLKVKAKAAGLWNLFLPHSPQPYQS
jgi:acyl-CoA dehydrogenase